jgi:hypothetical protein
VKVNVNVILKAVNLKSQQHTRLFPDHGAWSVSWLRCRGRQWGWGVSRHILVGSVAVVPRPVR